MGSSIDLIFKIAGVGILVSVLNTILKHAGKEEQGQIVTLAGLAIVFIWVIQLLANLFDQVKSVFRLF
ncbi:MAG TPA: stage III sporulation protein AC [Pelotomaculum sp.]|jgi:stage III sporulation protein AC|uniref:Stage III sporulation protein AC/AD protein family protein n=1 Tax=Pelotomaculum schinkii TaxID=78350 RepID=A0A4Y7RCU4_9FIRM|nr:MULTISPECIES: stage III sporulation protein AC [Pelotomaculum]TEB06652.1 Stage III sporulation protein AC/AD protein family protein [Pelotomaculum schinkii]TEB17553.1 Stage III sporulation protein AC/AD protein family protein [Pelotomaculum sp. FP]HBC93541.1 stage III sporulation protein AC [Pelotomaculum sp.]